MDELMLKVEAAGLGLKRSQVRSYIFHLKYMDEGERAQAGKPPMVWYGDDYITIS